MLTLYSYPELFGVADNNAYGLKVFAFLRLCHVPFRHLHRLDASQAPRGQLPCIVDDGEAIGDSDTILAHLIHHYHLTIDDGLTVKQRDLDRLIARMLDDLYWVMSYSRWQDDRFWPLFRDALLDQHPGLTEEGLLKAREFNFQRYYYQGIGRYQPEEAYARGLADLVVLAHLLPASGYLHGGRPTTVDAGIYGFIANIFSTRSTRRGGNSWPNTTTSCATARPSTRAFPCRRTRTRTASLQRLEREGLGLRYGL